MKKIKIFSIIFLLLSTVGCAESKTRITQFPERQYVYTGNAFVGMHEKTDRKELKKLLDVDPVRTEWCAAFVNAVLYVNGVPGSESVSENPLLARSFLNWGVEVYEPRMGDIVVFPRGRESWQGHVGFYVETKVIDDIDYWVILGGNQSDEVSYELYPAYLAISIRRYEISSNKQS